MVQCGSVFFRKVLSICEGRLKWWRGVKTYTNKKTVYIIKDINGLCFRIVVLLGFEPGLTEPKSDVLPLHHRTILMCFVKSSAKI